MTTSDPVRDVSAAEFETAVLERSRELPVLVDFWAPWCGPCRVLGPALEKLAYQMAGRFELIKVNVDESPEVAARYGVQGIPAVFLFRDAEVVDRFVGALPEAQIREFLRPWCPSEADGLVERGVDHLQRGELAEARACLEGALESEPESSGARLGLARLALREGLWDDLRSHVDAIPASADQFEAAQQLLGAAELARAAADVGTPEACEERLGESPDDLEARFALGGHAVARGEYRDALDHFLALAETDKSWHDEAARRAMLVVFGLLGARHPISDEYRDRLTTVYY